MTRIYAKDDHFRVWDTAHPEPVLFDPERDDYFIEVADKPTPQPEPAPMHDLLNEADMAIIPNMLSRLANTIVAASKFSKDLADARRELDSLKDDLEATRRTNVTLQETIDAISKERDEARDKVRSQTDELLRKQTDLDISTQRISELEHSTNTLAEKLEGARKERDDAQFRVLELTEALDKANARIKQVTEFMHNAMSVIRPDDAPTVPEVAPVPEPQASSGTSIASVEPSEPSTPPSDPAPRRVYEGEVPYGEFWNSGHVVHQDETGRWYYEAA